MANSYTAITASAGSGKTYTLVQRLLMICLRNPNGEKTIGNILALTFTNKAANEMKERILGWLTAFAGSNYQGNRDLANIREALAKDGVKLTMDDLHERSKKLLDYILHHYSILNIGTIDKFNSRLVKSFSQELGLAQNFNLEIQAEPYLIEAVDRMLDKIGDDDEISDAFMDFVNYTLDNNERVNLNDTLYRAAKEFVSDVHYEPLKKNQDFDWKKYSEAKNRLRKDIAQLAETSKKEAAETVQLLKSQNIEIEDFAGGKSNGLGKFFSENLKFWNGERDTFPLPASEESAQNTFAKVASASGKPKTAEISAMLDGLLEKRRVFIKNFITIKKKEKILASLLPLKVNKDIQDELAKIEEENDLVLLSKFNILINENLKNEPSSFIYEKVGARFQHYFFDEFQDTSELQWQNFLPLRDNAVASDHTSFTLVGDPKQSIYRFRGGESRLMLNIINQKEETQKFADVMMLKENWRSARNIVAFNNLLYRYHADFVNDEHKNIFGDGAEQAPMKINSEGRVKISLLENGKKEDFYTEAAEKMRNDIQHCLDCGYRLSDITILCRGNREIFNFSQKLPRLSVDYSGETVPIRTISESGLTLQLSHTIQAVIALLNWQNNRKNRQFLAIVLYRLSELGRIEMQDFSLETSEILALKSDREIENFIAEKYHVNLQPSSQNLNLYNYIEHFLKEFSVEGRETDFLLNFLEMLYGYTQNAGATMKDFLQFWDEEGAKKTILASENIDAVKIMTVHKSKGLEFSVVFIPMINENKDSQFSDWFQNPDVGPTVINTSQFGKELATYDTDIENFNSENSYKNLIDRLCVQYVATTRAVEQLYLYIERPSKTANHLEIFDFVQQKNPQNAEEFDFFEYQANTNFSPEKIEKPTVKSISSIASNISKTPSIKVATPSKSYQNRNESVRRGIFVHELLSKIKTEKDIPKILKAYLSEGQITTAEATKIEKDLLKIIGNYPVYFSGENEIISERDLMASDAGIYRPDRLIRTENGWLVVDFKTGACEEKHQLQVQSYRSILETFGEKVAGTEVVYV